MKPITSDGRSARWDEHRRRRHRELLRTVRHVVAEHGADLSMEQISARSGTTKTVLYRYFGDRSGLQAAMGDWAMHTIRRSLAAGSPEVYRFCDSAVSGGAPARGFLTDVTDLLCVRMGLTREAEVQWAAGALGFVRSCTEQWLLDPRDRHDFTTRLTTWLWDSSRSFMEVHR